MSAEVCDVRSGPGGVLCRLHVTWADPSDRRRGGDFVHAFMVRDGLITEIRRYDDLTSATAAIGAV